MTLVPHAQGWRIEGQGSERARLASAMLHNGQLAFIFPDSPETEQNSPPHAASTAQ